MVIMIAMGSVAMRYCCWRGSMPRGAPPPKRLKSPKDSQAGVLLGDTLLCLGGYDEVGDRGCCMWVLRCGRSPGAEGGGCCGD